MSRVVIVGGGITGLSAAYTLSQHGVEWTLLEARSRLGGNVLTERIDGFVLDAGPDSFLRTKPEALELVGALGLQGELIVPLVTARKVYLAHRGKLVPMPEGLALGVPTRFGPLLATPLLSTGGKLRALGDLLLPRGGGDDESIGGLIERRFGREVARAIVAPLLGGIYGGDVASLDVGATFPELGALERRHRSVMVGLWRSRRSPTLGSESPFRSLERGMGSLVEALVAALPDGAIRTGVSLERLERAKGPARFRLLLSNGETLEADALILAAAAHVAAKLTDDPELARELAGIPYLSSASVFLACDKSQIAHPLDASGFLVPPGEGEISASTWVSSKWDGRAPEGAALLRVFIGHGQGGLDLARDSDQRLIDHARQELERLIGPIGPLRLSRVYRYVGARPQPVVGHIKRLERIQTRLAALPGLFLAGAAYRGVGLPDCIRQGKAAAEQALGSLG